MNYGWDSRPKWSFSFDRFYSTHNHPLWWWDIARHDDVDNTGRPVQHLVVHFCGIVAIRWAYTGYTIGAVK